MASGVAQSTVGQSVEAAGRIIMMSHALDAWSIASPAEHCASIDGYQLRPHRAVQCF